MNMSLVIASRNRARMLARALGSLAEVRVPAGLSWEVVLVDNGSSDSTAEVMQAASRRLRCTVRVVKEFRHGVAHAWNRGLRSARGEIIAFADDDVTFERNWLGALWEAFGDDGVQVVQGQMDLVFPKPAPAWVDRQWAMTFLGHFGPEESGDHLVGGNFAARSEVFEKVGYFDINMPDLWDTEYSRRVIRAGYRIDYVPAMQVDHHMPRSRFVGWRFIRQNYWWGRSATRLESTGLSWQRYARWLTKEALTELMMASWSLLGGETMKTLEHLCRVSNRVGILRSVAGERLKVIP